ncbi:XRE family transcriptional regulator [Pediococcus ethanolidurans]|uniref:helix-turn-helix domain-containing protein n=1 Tax=Pediococcus ethanolidurans TaxID=319653 RepID=UPI0021AAB764|nr:helix-turn-helix transcriptional regulator [Pediococcus ethanolidurans]MCT4397331.1 XRE family transcriptional regulator [Pediococcus ethanolidurans]
MMIRNNFAIILAERQLRITRVANDTGISRTTLTALSQNSTKMVQIETVNNLCMYLDISTQEFFSFIPIDVNFNVYVGELDENQYEATHLLEYDLSGFMNIKTKQKKLILPLIGGITDIGTVSQQTDINQLDSALKLKDEDDINILEKYICPLSTAFKADIQNILVETAKKAISKEFDNNDISFTNNIFDVN